jgi:hypothetical protein
MKKGSVTSKLKHSFFVQSKARSKRQTLLLKFAEFHHCREKLLEHCETTGSDLNQCE